MATDSEHWNVNAKISGSIWGACFIVTALAGPPESMIPFGAGAAWGWVGDDFE